MMKDKYILIAVATLAVAWSVACFGFGRWDGARRLRASLKAQVDTVFIRETISVEKPVEITRRVVERVLVPVVDTMRLHDTTYLALQRTEKVYGDSTYRAVVSGVDPSLDEMTVYFKKQVVKERYYETVDVRLKPRWSFGVQAGYGAAYSPGGAIVGSPYVGIGIQRNILSWGYEGRRKK